jgi:cytoskeleton protein RodZ
MSENIGQQLRQARERRELSLEQVSSATHIRLHYLQAIEAGKLEEIPSAVQARGFVRSYASYLGIDPDSTLSSLDKQMEVIEQPALAEESTSGEDKPAGNESVDAIYKEVGLKLKRQRELLGLSLDEVERHTHLRQHYLEALESGNLAGLPSPVQGRGMLNNYASFLGLDPEPLLLNFAQGLQTELAARQATRPAPSRPAPVSPRPPGALRRIFSGETLLAVVIALALIGFVIWGAVRIFAMRFEQVPSPTAPSIADVLLAAPSPTSLPTSLPPTPTVPPLPAATNPPEETPLFAIPPGSQVGVQVYVTVRQRTWVRVTVDGEVVFEGRVLPGSAYQYEGDDTVDILTSNGAALQIFYNQQDLGPMGLFGQVVQRVYTLSGVQTPTPTITPTPTETPRLTATQPIPATPAP